MESNVLITGGFGFVGSHLVERLLTDKHRVHVVDNLSSSPVDHEAFVSRLGHPSALTFDICSVSEFALERNERGSFHFDEIFHLASVVGPVGVLAHAGDIARSIVTDTYHVVGLAKRHRARLCDVSTSEVYGGGRDGYCSEHDSKIIPAKTSVRLEYAVAKLASEVALTNMCVIGTLDAVIIRPFNISGPRQSPKGGFVLPRFIGQALQGQPLTVYGDGKMIRAFTDVRDVVDGIVRAMRQGRSGTAYNIGNPANKTTILELAQRVIRITATPSTIEFVDPKRLFGPLFEEANDKYPDADRAISELGWRPTAGIDAIIGDTMEYIQSGRTD